MRTLLAVAERELRERRAAFAAALVAGLVALAAPLLPWLPGGGFRDQCGVMALVLAGTLATGLAVTFGTSMITRDLRERRLGFYLARPIGVAALWFGKLAAGWLLVVGAAVLTLLPAVLVGALPGALLARERVPLLAAAAAVVALFLLLLAHASAFAVRSRSPLVLLDVVLLLAVAAAVAMTALRLARALAGSGVQRGLLAFATLALVALLTAGWVQLAVGRIDARRGHRALSLVLWSVLCAAAALFAVYGWWFLTVGPRDLTSVYEVRPAPRGPWMTVAGPAWGRGGYQPTFLLDAASGRNCRLTASATRMTEIAFSADGTQAAWVAALGLERSTHMEVETLDLADPGAHPAGTTIFPMSQGGYFGGLTLSADGHRLAVRDGRMLAVYEVTSGRLLMSVICPGPVAVERMSFLAPDRVRVVGQPEYAHNVERGDVTILELDTGSKTIRETGRIPDVQRTALFLLQGLGGPTLLVRDRRGDATVFVLADAFTGARVAKLATCRHDESCQARLLADGRVVVGEAGAGGTRLRVFSPSGAEEDVVSLPPARVIRLGFEPGAGTLVVIVAPDRLAESSDQTTLLVDLARKTWRVLGRGYRPAGWYWWFSPTAVAPESVASRLLVAPDRSLVLLDPSTDTFRTVVEVR
jgi:hypothetical protein